MADQRADLAQAVNRDRIDVDHRQARGIALVKQRLKLIQRREGGDNIDAVAGEEIGHFLTIGGVGVTRP